ncbi:two-component system regulatory protein YycI [Psychrobacillus glaciei]|uniref:two-component system regulatory protein YycI n=1 Tax=Psychrobacillus glaciei TaxID=2283160 RepID=UPI00178C7835|nr:two-component system regulatory protein YycI [Psychrobacillus glaciei]
MDWNKTKTIFIIVFSILNVFLFSLYLNRYNDAQDIEVRSDTPIEERFLLDNIKVPKMESDILGASYVSGNLHTFSTEELDNLPNQKVEVKSSYQLTSTFDKPLPITEENKLEKVLQENIIRGNSYGLWSIDEENHSVTFFQKVNNRLVYNNKYAKLIVHFNDKQELVSYEQSLLDNLEDYNESKSLLSSMQAIKVLYKRGILKPDSTVKEANLGYSTLAQLEGTQVFAPTWHILVKLSDETSEEYFVNAVEGRIIEIPKESEQTEVK